MKKRRRALFFLFILVGAEAVVAPVMWDRFSSRAIYGAIVKDRGDYIVAWRNTGTGLEYHRLSSLHGALEFAEKDLALVQSVWCAPGLELESIWLEDRLGSFVLFWKEARSPFLNRMSFDRQEDALFFAQAFQSGSYRPSPYGHSIALRPR